MVALGGRLQFSFSASPASRFLLKPFARLCPGASPNFLFVVFCLDGFSIKQPKVKLLAGEQKATESCTSNHGFTLPHQKVHASHSSPGHLRVQSSLGEGRVGAVNTPIRGLRQCVLAADGAVGCFSKIGVPELYGYLAVVEMVPKPWNFTYTPCIKPKPNSHTKQRG